MTISHRIDKKCWSQHMCYTMNRMLREEGIASSLAGVISSTVTKRVETCTSETIPLGINKLTIGTPGQTFPTRQNIPWQTSSTLYLANSTDNRKIRNLA